jgi:hypothetical protein
VVGEYLWDVQQGGDQPVSISFAGVVGEELSFSSFMLTGASLENAYLGPNALPYMLVEARALLSGSFSITVVPEPETYAMFLAGLGLLGFMSRSSYPDSIQSRQYGADRGKTCGMNTFLTLVHCRQ